MALKPSDQVSSHSHENFRKLATQFWPGAARHRSVHQPRQHHGQMEPAVDTVRGHGAVGLGMIVLLDGLTAPTRGALGVDQFPIGAARFWHFTGSAKTCPESAGET